MKNHYGKTKKAVLQFGMLLALLGALSLSGCGDSDPGASGNEPGASGQNAANSPRPNSSSSKDTKDKSLDGVFEYTLMEDGKTVLLTKYIGDAAQVTVYGSYSLSGRR